MTTTAPPTHAAPTPARPSLRDREAAAVLAPVPAPAAPSAPSPSPRAALPSYLQRVTRGKVREPLRVLIYGKDGSGKTTFAAKFPGPLFLAAESGTSQLDVARMPIADWRDGRGFFEWWASDSAELRQFATLAIDTIDWLAPMIDMFVCQRDDGTPFEGSKKHRKLIRDGKPYLAGYGYGDGPKVALEEWLWVVDKLEAARSRRGAEVVFIAHEAVRKENNVGGANYGVIDPAVHRLVADKLCQWCDAVLYVEFRKLLWERENEFTKRAKVITDGTRVMHTESYGAHRAKNRYNLPREMDLDCAAFRKAVDEHYGDPVARRAGLRAEIAARVVDLADEALAAKVRAHVASLADDDESGLLRARARLIDLWTERATGEAAQRHGASEED